MNTNLIERNAKGQIRPWATLPWDAMSTTAKKGMRLANLKHMGIIPGIAGGAGPERIPGERGYNAAADLVTQTSDGFDLNTLWDEFQAAVTLANAERTRIVQFLTFPVSNPMERVAQVSAGRFEKASEYGEPVGIRPAASYFRLGYDMDWYDLGARFTWKFLLDAPRNQVDAINAMALEADNINIYEKVMDTLFNPANRLADINGEEDVNVYALYNADGTVPPRYKNNVHDGTHTHYLASGAATIDSGDLDTLEEHLVHHGYSKANGYTLIVLMNRSETAVVRSFRMADGDSYDFINAVGTPGMYLPRDVELMGGQPGANFQGLSVVGSYGNLLIIEEDSIPPGYTVALASGGPENLGNPVGFRQHPNASAQGLRLVKGPNPDYPLIDSFYNRGFGTGIRQRGGAVVMKITAGSYTKPTTFLT